MAVPRVPRGVAVPRISVAATLSRARRRDRRPPYLGGEGALGVDVRSRPAPLLWRLGRGALAGEPRRGRVQRRDPRARVRRGGGRAPRRDGICPLPPLGPGARPPDRRGVADAGPRYPGDRR